MILTFGLFTSSANAQNRGVVFSIRQTTTVWGQNGSPAWTPDRKRIVSLEALLESYIKSHPYTPPGGYDGAVVANALKYGRQYMGITKNGRKLIFVNAFCEIPKYWREKVVQTQGGGSCFFGVFFDPKTSQFSGLEYNEVK